MSELLKHQKQEVEPNPWDFVELNKPADGFADMEAQNDVVDIAELGSQSERLDEARDKVAEALGETEESFEDQKNFETGDEALRGVFEHFGLDSAEMKAMIEAKLKFLQRHNDFNKLVPDGIDADILHNAMMAQAAGEPVETDDNIKQFTNVFLQNV